MARSQSPAALGFRRESVGGRTFWRPPPTGYYLAGEAATVPLQFDRTIPVIETRLNGRATAPMVVDTGSPFTLLGARAGVDGGVRTVTTNEQPAQRVSGLTGAELACLALIDQFGIGALAVTNLGVLVRLEEPTTDRTSPASQSLLGLQPVLAGSAYVTLDYPHRQLTIAPRAVFQPPSAGVVDFLQLPMVFTNGGLRVAARFPNGHQTQFVIDTGAAADFVLTSATIQAAGLREAVQRGRPGTMRGVGGDLMEIAFTIDSVELGGRSFTATRCLTASWSPYDLLGSGWLQQFRTTFDFRRGILWLERP